jgi:hypothetical protein
MMYRDGIKAKTPGRNPRRREKRPEEVTILNEQAVLIRMD